MKTIHILIKTQFSLCKNISNFINNNTKFSFSICIIDWIFINVYKFASYKMKMKMYKLENTYHLMICYIRVWMHTWITILIKDKQKKIIFGSPFNHKAIIREMQTTFLFEKQHI